MTANSYVIVETFNEEDAARIRAAKETLWDIKTAIDKVDSGATSGNYPFMEMINLLETILEGGVL